jgi:CheY-like chemotaxis protein/signal transduction histidine kinase/HAMP domain-containing protein
MQLKFLKNMKIRNKIIMVPLLAGVAFALILVVNTYLGSRNNELISSIDQQYFPALQVSRELEETLSDIQSNMQYAASAMDEDVLLEADKLRDNFLALTDSSSENNILSQSEISFLETEFKSYYPLARATTMQMISEGITEDVIASLDNMQLRYNTIQSELAKMTSEKKEAMTSSVSEARDNQQTVVFAILVITILSIVLQLIATLVSTRSVTGPLQNIVKAANDMAMGKVDVEIHNTSSDEIGELAQSTARLLETTKSLARAAEAIGQGDYSVAVERRSEEDILGNAISEMQYNLLKMTKENERQDWLKTGLAELSNSLRGDQDVVELAQNVIHFTAEYTHAKVGAIYLVEGNSKLHLTGSYAYKKRKNLSNDFEIGEGLVGQCALEKKTILISDIPDDYIKINSGLGEATPLNIIVIPLVYDDEINGVIELGSFKELDDLQISFLEQASENISIAFQSAVARKRVNELLEETQAQTAELQAQQEELRVTNEELEEQTQNLQQSEQRLKKQQEELKKSNLELEKHTDELKEKQVALEAARSDIEQKAKQLEESSKYKSEFLANMSHELRTPLNSIQILSRLFIENKAGNLTDKQINYARTINSSGSDLLNLINEILDLSKIEAGKMSINLEKMEITSFASYLKNNFEHQTDQKGLSFKVNIDEKLPQHIVTDRQRVEQIIKNLISNALKFTESGGITVDVNQADKKFNLDRSGLKHDNAAVISVTDTGIGIDQKNLDKIFEAFQQEDGTTSRRYGGTGLGLSISVQLSKLLGGEVQVESQLGKGSSFHLFLPLDHPDAEELDIIPEAEYESSPVQVKEEIKPVRVKEQEHLVSNEIRDDRNDLNDNSKTILIIEDDNNFAKVLFDFTRDKNHKALIACDGEAGLQLAYQYKPDAIILDIGLPRMDGWMVMEKLKQNSETRHIPVYFMSGHDKRMDAMQKGAIGYLTKPVTKEGLDAAFTRIDTTISKDIKKLLVIEDDDVMRQSMIELIGNSDVTISEAVKGNDALKMLKSEDFDCVVLDLGLSDISGFDLVEKIKNDKKIHEIPIIIYTGKDLSKKEENQLNRYAESIIIKGVKSTDRLLDELSLFLHRVEKDSVSNDEKPGYQITNGEDVFKGKKVLIADDDPRNIFALTSILEDKEMEVLIAENGKEAIEVLEKNEDVDLVLMDIMMPEMDGYQAMEKIRKQKQYQDLPMIALTAKAMKGDRQKCIDSGANDYLSKPLDVEKLLSLLQIWLYKRVSLN